MKILFGKTFGIGNAVMAVPAIKALSTLGVVDVLVGTTKDDGGARTVIENLVGKYVRKLHFDIAAGEEYDIAVMSIPFDGRWRNGTHFSAKKVLDGRTRPDPTTFGFSSWLKHEVEYQMDNVRELGFNLPTPSLLFRKESSYKTNDIYIGFGYKKDQDGFWKKKHWGNENYAEFICEVSRLLPQQCFRTTGDERDIDESIGPVMEMVRKNKGNLVFLPTYGLNSCFDLISSCKAYVGNDTGMMHVASSYNKPIFALFGLRAEIKNAPLSQKSYIYSFDNETQIDDPKKVANLFVEFLEGKK